MKIMRTMIGCEFQIIGNKIKWHSKIVILKLTLITSGLLEATTTLRDTEVEGIDQVVGKGREEGLNLATE